MKLHIILLLLLIISLNSCFSDKHLMFKDIPVDGNIETLAAELAKAGFTDPVPAGENQIKLTGEFLGKDCDIYVYGTEKSRIAYKVRADLPKEDSDSVRVIYERLQEYCSSKHGPGTKKYQKFNNSSRFIFNEPKLTRTIKVGDYTRFISRTGTIYLVVRSGYLSVIFIDRRNDLLRKEESCTENTAETY